MGPLRKPVDRDRFDRDQPRGDRPDIEAGIEGDAPEMTDQDWESLEGAAPDDKMTEGDGDAGDGIESAVRSGIEVDGDLPEEDDDNPDQDSDEALPDDEEEQALRRDMSGIGTRYEPE